MIVTITQCDLIGKLLFKTECNCMVIVQGLWLKCFFFFYKYIDCIREYCHLNYVGTLIKVDFTIDKKVLGGGCLIELIVFLF